MTCLTLITWLISFFIYGTKIKEEISSDEVIFDLMKKSNLPYIVCKDIFNILNSFQQKESEIAYKQINNELIPHLKTGSIGNVGIAFGMLIDEIALTDEEAVNFSTSLMSEMLQNTNETEKTSK